MAVLATIGTALNRGDIMPELPEVETVKEVLKPIVIHQTIKSVDVLRKTTILGDVQDFIHQLEGKTFLNITRIGKFLIFHLSDDLLIISHLRMEGKFFEVEEKESNTKYARVVFHLGNNKKICYDDSRCFGIMKLSSEAKYQSEKEIASLGPEPFDVKDVSYLMNRTKKSHLPIKSVLLDQTLMTGLGNIYDDEVLFASHVHPLTPANLISKEEWELIVKNAQRILKEAIHDGGSTIRSYHPGKNIDGNFQSHLLAYGHKDEDCVRCGHPMRFIKVNGRGTTFCPICQIKKGLPQYVAVYGLVGSGKSLVAEELGKLGYAKLSCDDVVSTLYNQKEIADHINTMFQLPASEQVDKTLLRQYLVNHPKDQKKLERYIHPLVKKQVNLFLKKNPLAVVEVPLLFEAKMENMFDVLIAVDVEEKIRLDRLVKRDPSKGQDLAKINTLHPDFIKNKRKADFIITNNLGLSELHQQIKVIFDKLASRQN